MHGGIVIEGSVTEGNAVSIAIRFWRQVQLMPGIGTEMEAKEMPGHATFVGHSPEFFLLGMKKTSTNKHL
jgi:hypothetical protein